MLSLSLSLSLSLCLSPFSLARALSLTKPLSLAKARTAQGDVFTRLFKVDPEAKREMMRRLEQTLHEVSAGASIKVFKEQQPFAHASASTNAASRVCHEAKEEDCDLNITGVHEQSDPLCLEHLRALSDVFTR